MAILQLIVGILFLSEVLSRICGGNTPREVYYNLCRPFFLRMPMHFSIFNTYQVERIRLKVSDVNHRRQYLRSLPLHHSQHEVERHSDYSVFEVRVAPTYDFIQQILSMGGEVEVLSPDYVRAEIKRRIKEMAALY